MPTSRMESCGVLSEDGHGHYDALPFETATDSRGFIWDPLPLPDKLQETGRLWGEWSYYSPPSGLNAHLYTFPARGSLASWLDCSRTITEVEVFFCHPDAQKRLHVIGLAFHYADGERELATIGYCEIKQAEERAIESLRNWCQCDRGQRAPPFKDRGPHCWSTRWTPAEQRIKALRIFLDKHGALSGLQFLDGTNGESRLWGFQHADGSIGEITFGEGEVVGVKFFMNENNRRVTYDDVVVVALQAVARS
jgi:hypothetical protein